VDRRAQDGISGIEASGNDYAPSDVIAAQQLGDAIHELKTAGNLSPAERVIIYDDGTVTDESGYVLGNIYNES